MTAPLEPTRGFTGEPIRIGISSCLLGNQVRYDGGHKSDGFLGIRCPQNQTYLEPHPRELMLQNHV